MADCALAEDLAPPAGVSRAGLLSSWLLRTMRRGGRGGHDYGCVLLTGATGFVGRAVLAELLERGAEVRCLVRASSDAEAVARLQHALLLARRWRPEWRARLRVARGALGPEGLGMGADAWAALARSTAAIVHCGAAVDLKKGYAFHRRANVLGTREVLRLAGAARARLIFVSTTDVLPHAAAGVAAAEVAAAETACGAAEVKAADSGYAASKASPYPRSRSLSAAYLRSQPILAAYLPFRFREAVGEVLVSRAVARGEVAGCIARLGMVSACARTGRSHPHHAPRLAVISPRIRLISPDLHDLPDLPLISPHLA